MSKTDFVTVGRVLPRIGAVVALPPSTVLVTWAAGEREGMTDAVDLAPMLFVYKLYKPLRNDPELFKTVHVAADGANLAWGDDEAIDISADAVQELAEQTMTQQDFKEFLSRHKLTLDAAAAYLGISRRLVAYYTQGKTVPRTVALACAYLDTKLQDKEERSESQQDEDDRGTPVFHRSHKGLHTSVASRKMREILRNLKDEYGDAFWSSESWSKEYENHKNYYNPYASYTKPSNTPTVITWSYYGSIKEKEKEK